MHARKVRAALVIATLWLLGPVAIADDFGDAIVAYDRKDFASAIHLLRPIAEGGDVRAAMILGGVYYVGAGVPIDRTTSAEWMQRVNAEAKASDYDFVMSRWRAMADTGDPLAQVMLGTAYNSGLSGIPLDSEKALQWIRLAAEAGNAGGQLSLAGLYDAGDGVPKNPAEAFKWVSLAAEQGNPEAEMRLGGMYATGRGVKKDAKSGLIWLRRAAEAGYADAQYELGLIYDTGHGAPRDRTESVRWYRLSAAGGNPLAQNNLAVAYLQGKGAEKSLSEAFQFSRMAMHRVDLVKPQWQEIILRVSVVTKAALRPEERRSALFDLGKKCLDGNEVPQSDMLAYSFMDISARDESDDTLRKQREEARDSVGRRLREDQLARAQMFARDAAPP